jgi:hypothetical protein
VLDGSIWKTGSRLTNSFAGTTTGSIDLGGNLYTVKLGDFPGPTEIGRAGAGRVTAEVSIRGAAEIAGGGGPPTQPPEPSAAVPGALAAVVGTGWRGLWWR